MPNVTVAASMIGQFLKGVQARQASDDLKLSQQKGERMARAGNFFSMSNDLRQRSEDVNLTLKERDRLRGEAENLYAGGLELWGQMDAKPKAGGKKNPVMQVLQFLNPLAKRGDTGDTEFEETFSRILSGLGGPTKAGGGAEGPGMTDAGIAAAMENPAAAGFAAAGAPGELGAAIAPPGTPATPPGGSAVPGDRGMSTPTGEVGPFSAATATQGLQPRPTSILNADGTRSSERSITVEVAELNGGRPTNIPTIYEGQQLSDEQAIKIAVQSGGVDRETGRPFQSFNSNEEAVAAAGQRSDALGAAAAPGAVPGAMTGAMAGAFEGRPRPAPPAPPTAPYVSPYFRDPKAERAAQHQQMNTILGQLRQSVLAKGIDSVEKLQADPQGMQVIQELQYLASENKFTQFDELDEIYAVLGLQKARTPKNQFEDDYFRLARRAAGEGEPLTDREQQQFAQYQKLRRTGSDRVLSPNDQMFEAAKLRNRDPVTGVIDMEKSFAEWTKTTAKSGTQGFQKSTGINPSTQRTEVMMVNNRTGDITWPGIEVPSDFTFDAIMTRNPYGQGSFMDSGKIRFYYDRGDFSYEALNWFLQDMPPMALDPITDNPIPNPEREKLERFIETLPNPSEIATIREFVTAWNSDPANATPDRQITFEEARDKMRSLGLPIGGSAIAAWRDAREGG